MISVEISKLLYPIKTELRKQYKISYIIIGSDDYKIAHISCVDYPEGISVRLSHGYGSDDLMGLASNHQDFDISDPNFFENLKQEIMKVLEKL